MTACSALYRLRLLDGAVRLARGTSDGGPAELLAPDASLDAALAAGSDALRRLGTAAGTGPVPAGARLLAPVESQEVWAAGVTYERSRDARTAESLEPDVYDRVYDAERPELFFKAPGWRVRAPGEPIAVRADSAWNVPEPELAVVIGSDLSIAALTIGNDVSSRDIEGENPLYLPQAKVYDGSCALGPALVVADDPQAPRRISIEILRGPATLFAGETSSARLRRSLADLTTFLGRALAFPAGAVLLTGTGIVPPDDVSLAAGDIVRIAIEGLGVLENPVETTGRPGWS